MPPRTLPLFRWMAAAALAGLATGVHADLIKVSPFLPPQNATSAVNQNSEIKYMGWVDTQQGTLFRVYDPAKKAGSFLKLGEKDTNLDVVVKQHDNDRDTLTVEHGGQTLTLADNDTKVSSSGSLPQMVPGPAITPGPMPNVSPAVTNTVVLNPTPADEQKRLEAVAAEVARRRALREQAQQQTQMQPQPGVQPPQAMPTRQDMQQQMQYQQGQQQQQQPRQRGRRGQ